MDSLLLAIDSLARAGAAPLPELAPALPSPTRTAVAAPRPHMIKSAGGFKNRRKCTLVSDVT